MGDKVLISPRQKSGLQAPQQRRLAAGALTPRRDGCTSQPEQHKLSMRPRDLKDAADLFHLRKLAAHVIKVTSQRNYGLAEPDTA